MGHADDAHAANARTDANRARVALGLSAESGDDLAYLVLGVSEFRGTVVSAADVIAALLKEAAARHSRLTAYTVGKGAK